MEKEPRCGHGKKKLQVEQITYQKRQLIKFWGGSASLSLACQVCFRLNIS